MVYLGHTTVLVSAHCREKDGLRVVLSISVLGMCCRQVQLSAAVCASGQPELGRLCLPKVWMERCLTPRTWSQISCSVDEDEDGATRHDTTRGGSRAHDERSPRGTGTIRVPATSNPIGRRPAPLPLQAAPGHDEDGICM